jgi:hypothetical protein
MDAMSPINAPKSLNLTESDESGAVCEGSVTNFPIGMAEIVRVFDEEREARGWREKKISTAATDQQRALEFIDAKLDAAESRRTDVAREAEARARASYGDEQWNCNRKRLSAKKPPIMSY